MRLPDLGAGGGANIGGRAGGVCMIECCAAERTQHSRADNARRQGIVKERRARINGAIEHIGIINGQNATRRDIVCEKTVQT